MKLLVTGADGQVGWELSRRLMPFGEIFPLGRHQCNFLEPERLPSIIRRIKPDVIVNAAAYTAVDKAELDEKSAITINATSVGVIAEEARRAGILLVHYSTDYVFDGLKETAYTEEDSPRPINVYGHSKLAGDCAIVQTGGIYAILRTSWVYSDRKRNFVGTILKSARKGEEVRVVTDQIGSPTWARDISDTTAYIIQAILKQQVQFTSGIFNVTASGTTSWYGFAQAIIDEAVSNRLIPSQPAPNIEPIQSHEYQSIAARPKNSCLAGNRLNEQFAITLPHWRQALSLCVKEMKVEDRFE